MLNNCKSLKNKNFENGFTFVQLNQHYKYILDRNYIRIAIKNLVNYEYQLAAVNDWTKSPDLNCY